ncbi:MAG: quinolinate synthase NadA [Clostridia bacterium]
MYEEIKSKIHRLKEIRDAVIMAHYYVDGEVQAIADCVGDSYYLSKVAKESKHRVIVLCGVRFMGESAKILSPDKTVLMPDITADCPMAHMVSPEDIQSVREKNPGCAVVCYINSTAKIKSCCDVCVTSANAVKVVKGLPNKKIFFVPDENLGRYVAGQLPEKEFIFNEGYCPTHKRITRSQVDEARAKYPGALFAVHPECTPDVLDGADFIGSTSGIIKFVGESGAKEFIIGTETGIFYQLETKYPDKVFHTVNDCQVCPNMKLVTLEKIADCLEKMEPRITMEEDARLAANAPLERMLELSK